MAVTQTKALVTALNSTTTVFAAIAKADGAREARIIEGARNIVAHVEAFGLDDEIMGAHKRAAYVGLISIFADVSKARAVEYLDGDEKKRIEKGATPTPLQRAYGSARQRYSAALIRAAELDDAVKPLVKERAPKAPKAPADKAAPDVTKGAAPGGIPPVGKLDDMASIAATLKNVATWLAKFGRTNAGTLSGKDAGDAGSAARDTIRGFAEGVARVHSALQGAPVDKAKVKTQAARIKKAAPLALPAPEQAAA